MAARRGNLAEMRFLLSAGADPSRVGWEEHFTPLGETVCSGNVAAARLLLGWGADPNAPNDAGMGRTAATTLTGTPDPPGTPETQAQVIALIRSAGGR
ncbi:MAG: hypothetical protein V4671_08785 [Armatimonadota bacterium]